MDALTLAVQKLSHSVRMVKKAVEVLSDDYEEINRLLEDSEESHEDENTTF